MEKLTKTQEIQGHKLILQIQVTNPKRVYAFEGVEWWWDSDSSEYNYGSRLAEQQSRLLCCSANK